MNYQAIPFEMKRYPQWVLWKFESINGKPTKVPYTINGKKASVNNPVDWVEFDQLVPHIERYDGVGFVLTKNDPFAFIDLDHTDDQEQFARQQNIYNEFLDTYSELSPSGKGLHIICKGSIPQGRRRGKVEMYSSQRFMTMTGNVYNNAPITEQQHKLDNLFNALGATKAVIHYADEKQIYTDDELLEIAFNAQNGDKCYNLYHGHWQDYYTSQSEADHSLINIISYYCRNREQIARIFRNSALGARDKAKRSDYINKMIQRSFDNYIPPVDIGALAQAVKNEVAKVENGLNLQLLTPAQLFPNEIAKVEVEIPDLKSVDIVYPEQGLNVSFEGIPDGFIKELARFIYAQAPRPVKPIAVITALAIMSGVCGRSYNVSGTGLNNYFVLLAPTGIGKEGISKGVNKLFNSIIPQQPLANSFLGIGELVSGVALLRYLAEESQSCLSIQGEFGMTMQRMTGRSVMPNMLQLRKVILDLYGKSGNGEIMRSTVYADKQKNIKEIEAPAFTMLAESTPSTFYEALSDDLVDEGLISRFNIVECEAIRPPLNKAHNKIEVPEDLRNYFLNLVSNALTLNSTNQIINVEFSPEAEKMFDNYDRYCDDKINSSSDESYRQLWNRGHLKSLKIASLFAIGDNMYKPIISKEHAQCAIDFVTNSILTIYKKYTSKEIGAESISFERQVQELTRVIGNIIKNIHNDKSIKDPKMRADFVIPYSTLQSRTSNLKAFKDRYTGGTGCKNAIAHLVDVGCLQEIKLHTLKEKYNFSGKAWAISNAKFFLESNQDNTAN